MKRFGIGAGTTRLLAVLAVSVLGWSGALGSRPAAAADQLILGKYFLASDPQVGVDPAKRKLVVIAKEAASPNGVVGDPLANGAVLDIIAAGPGGANMTEQTFTLPPGAGGTNGIPGWKASAVGYTYKDTLGLNGPVKVAQIKKSTKGDFLLKAVVLGKLGGGPQPHVTVLPPAPGAVGGASFAINGGDTYCAVFGDIAGGVVTNTPVPAGTKKFSVKNATAEVGCPNGE